MSTWYQWDYSSRCWCVNWPKNRQNQNTIVSIFYSWKFHRERGHRCYYTNECTYISVLIFIKCTSTLYLDTCHIYLTYIHLLWFKSIKFICSILLGRTHIQKVAEKRKAELETFLRELLVQAREISEVSLTVVSVLQHHPIHF